MERHYTYVLEKYRSINTRFTCPHCEKPHEFTRYINPSTGDRLPDHVGICNRGDKCGYRYTAGEYFKENPEKRVSYKPLPIEQEPIKPPSFIRWEECYQTLNNYQANSFYLFLESLVGESAARSIVKLQNVGTYAQWNGASIFWQVDRTGNIRTGKIMIYEPVTGKRMHGKQNWVHSTLGDKDFNLSQCLFGEHLLARAGNEAKPIGLVESEKTAIIASYFYPDLIWLATGGKSLFNPGSQPDRFKVLQGKTVIIYPDLGTIKSNHETPFEEWNRKSEILRSLGVKCMVSDFLERRATLDDRENGLDIADFLIRDQQKST